MQRLNNRQRMRGTIEKVRIAEGNVLRPCLNLLANIFQYHVAIDNPKRAVVNRHNRAVTAVMLAAAAASITAVTARLCRFTTARFGLSIATWYWKIFANKLRQGRNTLPSAILTFSMVPRMR